jgi:hypothetical protein
LPGNSHFPSQVMSSCFSDKSADALFRRCISCFCAEELSSSIKMLILTICLTIAALSHAAPIGTVNTSRLTSLGQLNRDALWIQNQSSSRQCLCTVLSRFPTALLFNSFSNGSCQLFFALPFTYTLQSHPQSTLILLRPLPPREQAPCCSNLTWLMTRIVNSAQTPVSLNSPTYLVIDDLDYLAVISYDDKLYRFNRTTMAQVSSTWIANQCLSVNSYNKQYFVGEGILAARLPLMSKFMCFVGCGTGSSSRLYVLSTRTLSSITNISVPNDARDVKFIRNGTVMLVSMGSPSTIAFYNVSATGTYAFISTLNAPSTPYTMYYVNDALLHVSTRAASTPVLTLEQANGTGGWTWGSFPATRSSSTTYNFQSTFDACGRMWVSIKGYGIRIFDTTGSQSLYNWSLTNGLNTIALTKAFDLYAADYGNNLILSYRPDIDQCTS